MASPHVAGLAALVFTKVSDTNSNGLLNDEVRSCIQTYADNIGVTGIGSGRINAYNAVVCSGALPPLPPPSDTTPPVTSITSPLNGSIVSGTITVSATASDSVGVTSVELYQDGVLAATDTASPYEFTWDTTQSPSGAHTLQTKAYDAAGNIGSSSIISVTVDNTAKDTTPPVTSIISPLNNATVARRSSVSIAALATDETGVSKVEFYVNAFLQCSDTSSPYSCSWKVPGAPGKTYKFSTKAFDTSNNSALSSMVNVTAK